MTRSRAQAVRIVVIVLTMAGLSYALRLKQLAESYRGVAERHASLAAFRTSQGARAGRLAQERPDRAELAQQAERDARMAEYHRDLQLKYERAAERPWLTPSPDPDPPE